MVNNLIGIFKKIFLYIGLLTSVFFFYFYFISDNSSAIRKHSLPTTAKILGVGSQYSGFVANSFGDIFNVISRGLGYKFSFHSYPKIDLLLDLNTMKDLDQQRKDYTNERYAKGSIKLYKDNSSKVYKVKVKAKGDRDLHRLNFNQMSFKVDIKGENRLLNLEEFSIQHPIIRNYGWELLINRYVKKLGIMAPDYIPVDFSVNGVDRGVYILEEGFTQELIEKNKRKNGPIFSVDQEFGLKFPNVIYKVHTRDQILKNLDNEYLSAVKKIDYLKSNSNNEFDISSIFDIKIWAKYFAIIDLFQAYHGAVPKSVKLYYNPSTTKFEPIFHDGHVGGANYRNFILSDLVSSNDLDYRKYIKDNNLPENDVSRGRFNKAIHKICGYACLNQDWFRVFFNKKNKEFLKLYKENLLYVISKDSFKLIDEIIDSELNVFNNSMYSSFSPSDRVVLKGVLPYYFDKEHLNYRSRLIESKILNNPLFKFDSLEGCYDLSKANCDKNKLINISSYFDTKLLSLKNFNSEKISLKKANYLSNNYEKKSGELFLEDGTVIIFTGNTKLHNLKIKGKGMIVQLGGSINIKNTDIEHIKNINIPGVNWSGAFNIIDSSVYINGLSLTNTYGEDSVNIVSSKVVSEGEVYISNVESDGLDIDFSDIKLEDLNCNNIGNDCIDISGSIGKIDKVIGIGIKDKMVSIGEGSEVYINKATSKDTEIGIAVKDSSVAHIDSFTPLNTLMHFTVFNKKPHFSDSLLTVKLLNNINHSDVVHMVSKGSSLKISDILIKGTLNNKKIISHIYEKSSIKH